MPGTVTVNLAKPITSVRVLDDYHGNVESSVTGAMNPATDTERARLAEDLRTQKNSYSEACLTLQGVASKLNQFYDEIFAGRKEEIAGLSLEIARKILMQKVEDGDYEIKSIVMEALKSAPGHQDLVVHLNSQDLAACRKIQQDDEGGGLAGVKLVADQDIGRAECVIESPKGIIKSLIEEHLDQIGKALNKAE